MTNTSLKLSKKIPESLLQILEAIFTITEKRNLDSFVIGAKARDLILEYGWSAGIARATEDVDFGVAVKDWTEYKTLMDALIATGNFERDRKQEQRVWFQGRPDGTKVDLVPFGAIESSDHSITFPPGDFVMSTLGFEEASKSALNLVLPSGQTARIATLAGVSLLKFIAFSDRARDRDARDIWFIAENYLAANNEDRLYGDHLDLLEDPDFDLKISGARLLGRDIAALLTPVSHRTVLRILASEADDGLLERFADVIYRFGLQDADRYDPILRMLLAMKQGIIESFEPESNAK